MGGGTHNREGGRGKKPRHSAGGEYWGMEGNKYDYRQFLFRVFYEAFVFWSGKTRLLSRIIDFTIYFSFFCDPVFFHLLP